MDIAIVTGGNSGIGLAISKKLITLGFRVYAIGDDFSKTPFAHKDFCPLSVPNDNTEALTQAAKNLLENSDNLCIFVNAQVRKTNLAIHSISLENIKTELNQYLLHPLLLTRLLIDKLRQFQGFIINISYENPCNSLSAAIEGGLSAFYNALFEEYRQQGVNVTQLILQSVDDHNLINCDMIANTLDHLIRFKGGNAVTKILIRPQDAQALTKIPQITPSIDEFKEIQLPTKYNYPEEQEPIQTSQPLSRRKSSPPPPSPKKPQKPKISEKTAVITPPIAPAKISRDAIIIPREKKQKTPAVVPVIEAIKKKTKPRPIAQKPVEPQAIETPKIPKLTRDTIIIPREKKTQKSEVSPITEQTNNKQPNAPVKTALRIRRGRPPTTKEL